MYRHEGRLRHLSPIVKSAETALNDDSFSLLDGSEQDWHKIYEEAVGTYNSQKDQDSEAGSLGQTY